MAQKEAVLEKIKCPYLEEAGVTEVCDFEDMFKRTPTKEDCCHCLAGLVEGRASDAEYWRGRYATLLEALQREASLLLQVLMALQEREYVTTTELSQLIHPHPKLGRLRKLLRLLPVKAVRVGRGYRWRILRVRSFRQSSRP